MPRKLISKLATLLLLILDVDGFPETNCWNISFSGGGCWGVGGVTHRFRHRGPVGHCMKQTLFHGMENLGVPTAAAAATIATSVSDFVSRRHRAVATKVSAPTMQRRREGALSHPVRLATAPCSERLAYGVIGPASRRLRDLHLSCGVYGCSAVLSSWKCCCLFGRCRTHQTTPISKKLVTHK